MLLWWCTWRWRNTYGGPARLPIILSGGATQTYPIWTSTSEKLAYGWYLGLWLIFSTWVLLGASAAAVHTRDVVLESTDAVQIAGHVVLTFLWAAIGAGMFVRAVFGVLETPLVVLRTEDAFELKTVAFRKTLKFTDITAIEPIGTWSCFLCCFLPIFNVPCVRPQRFGTVTDTRGGVMLRTGSFWKRPFVFSPACGTVAFMDHNRGYVWGASAPLVEHAAPFVNLHHPSMRQQMAVQAMTVGPVQGTTSGTDDGAASTASGGGETEMTDVSKGEGSDYRV
ncbi:unnamed protein product [Vitrella brassicaformis CCMP3155]|uniref:Uncharacterized protein n=1 Tax=Vitrella brassicaformis (strain CCMP3155) TaxID=1169540 RepID=A0A0G4GIY2_VITBC|nr:unnamed protein product [Vitrella brassicaformis CCMP3155]|eukprot:CEM29785.1 unnamed protein product [Vitrella brassicaformis CCMP3155]